MDKAYFLEDTTSKQQEDLPYDEGFSQVKVHHGYNLTSRYDILDVSNQTNLTEDESQEKATYRETCQEADMTMTLDKMTENAVSKTCDKENQCTINLPIPANQEDTSKSNISDILPHHLCKEEFSKDQGIDCETLPEISNNDSFDEAIIKNIIVWHVKNSWPTEQSSELTDQLNSKSDDENSNKPSCSLTMTEENTSDSDELVAVGESNHEENSNFLTKIKSLHDKQKSCLWQTPQKQAEKANSGNKFKYGHSQVYYWFFDFSKVAPKVKIPKNNIIDKPLITDPQASFSPKLREKSAVGQDISESTSRSNYVEKQEQIWETTEPSQLVEMEPTVHIHQEHLAGIESEPNLSKLPSTSKEDPSLSSSYIFQKISQGKEMCQKLKEQTDQLKAKVQEFSKRIAQDSPYHFQHRRLVLEKLQGRLELLEQEFLANKEKHLTLKERVHRHESRAVSDFDPQRKVEGEIFKLEMLLKDFKEKINKSKCTSAVSLLMNSPINLDDLSFTSSPPSNEVIQQPTLRTGCCSVHSSSLSAIRVMTSAYLRLLIFLPAISIPACPYHFCPLLCPSLHEIQITYCQDAYISAPSSEELAPQPQQRVQQRAPPEGSRGKTDSTIQTALSKNKKTILTRANGHEVVFCSRVAPVLDQRLSPTAVCRGLTCGFYCNAGFDSVGNNNAAGSELCCLQRLLRKERDDMRGTWHTERSTHIFTNKKTLKPSKKLMDKKITESHKASVLPASSNASVVADSFGNPLQHSCLGNPMDRGGCITMNKATGGDGIPAELFQVLKDDAVKALHSICQQIWKTWQWLQDWKRSVFIPIPKKGNAKECSDYHTIALISNANKVMLKILQARFQ
ncbi:hypothetical protein FD754_004461 [Muntiacus muntjak]|uniref:AKNA domain-containing protein n=1 Tax=Muntiacus muntjak TaxID=9888 RepID=A0A5N3WHW6_MUNMU|nr:hypothetical protein FD754_004461 [Muntiacus muntjak]